MHPVSRVRNDVKYVAVTQDVARLVTSLVFLVPRQRVGRAVSTPSVRPRVLPLATGCLAL